MNTPRLAEAQVGFLAPQSKQIYMKALTSQVSMGNTKSSLREERRRLKNSVTSVFPYVSAMSKVCGRVFLCSEVRVRYGNKALLSSKHLKQTTAQEGCLESLFTTRLGGL